MSDVQTNSRHQAGLTALYLGIFAMVWFSVPAAEQPLRALLVVGSIAALLTAVAGGVLSARTRGTGGPRDRATDRRYLLIVVAEFAAAGLGAAVLAAAGWSEYIPVLVCAVVGLHFFPLAPLLRDPLLRPLGVALCVVAAAGLVTGLASAVSAGLVIGTGAGLLLLGYAVQVLVRAHRPA
ncbi:hypothetical protein GA0070607_3948 [Micromonospora coriariae]|uniref:Uncharacterized protein n=1 Tax=Micromonospora coriariae TaxID=285665 RepID=A0A1C4WPN2_9ACTN|nr:hypothetical protein [Micromonospora coriariae]SCE98170.1 hypothetical protein GA0070607_3948 [Micromonospora coriariae]